MNEQQLDTERLLSNLYGVSSPQLAADDCPDDAGGWQFTSVSQRPAVVGTPQQAAG